VKVVGDTTAEPVSSVRPSPEVGALGPQAASGDTERTAKAVPIADLVGRRCFERVGRNDVEILSCTGDVVGVCK